MEVLYVDESVKLFAFPDGAEIGGSTFFFFFNEFAAYTGIGRSFGKGVWKCWLHSTHDIALMFALKYDKFSLLAS